jgi:hypothetical protein
MHGLVYSNSSGKLGGGLVQSGANGSSLSILSRKKKNVTSSQLLCRAFFKYVSKLWRLQPVSTVTYFNALSSKYRPKSDIGVHAVMSGFQLFFNLQLNIKQAGIASFSSTTFFLSSVPSLPLNYSISSLLQSIVVSFPFYTDIYHVYIIYASAPHVVGSNIARIPFKKIISINPPNGISVDITSQYLTQFPLIFYSGQQIIFEYVSMYPYYPLPFGRQRVFSIIS